LASFKGFETSKLIDKIKIKKYPWSPYLPLPDKFSFEGQVWFKSFHIEGKVDESPSW
jgi:hypothetical protein